MNKQLYGQLIVNKAGKAAQWVIFKLLLLENKDLKKNS